jgi:hypothetical protein
MSDWRYPEGNGWSKLGGNYTVRGDWIYFEDGSRERNGAGPMITMPADNGVDYAELWNAHQADPLSVEPQEGV